MEVVNCDVRLTEGAQILGREGQAVGQGLLDSEGMQLLGIFARPRISRRRRERVHVVVRTEMNFVIIPEPGVAPGEGVLASGERPMPCVAKVASFGVLDIKLIADPKQVPVAGETKNM